MDFHFDDEEVCELIRLVEKARGQSIAGGYYHRLWGAILTNLVETQAAAAERQYELMIQDGENYF